MNKEAINKWVLLLLVFFISALFLSMISQFLMAIFLAGIFSALAYPLYRRFEKWFKGRRSLASIATLLLIVFVVVLPLGGLLGIVAAQAIKVGETVKPWVEEQLAEPDAITSALKSLPFYDRVEPHRNLILKKAGEMVGVIIGPIIAALFVTVWDIYGLAFKGVLPAVAASGSGGDSKNSSAEILPNDADSEKEPPPE